MIVAISGWRNSGKDTVAEYLIKNHGFKRLAFADLLKDLVSEEYQIDRSSLDDRDQKEAPLLQYPVEPKDVYTRMIAEHLVREFKTSDGKSPIMANYHNGQFLGVLYGGSQSKVYWTPRALAILEGSTKRSVDPNYWVLKAVEQTTPDGFYVISDARYKNEIDQLRLYVPGEVVSIRINRFDFITSTDASERDLDDYSFDYQINNRKSHGKTLQDVYEQIEVILANENASRIRE